MRQTLFYIPDTIFGLPLFGFGLLLAAWAILGIGLLVFAMATRRWQWSQDAIGHIVMWVVMGAAIWKLLPMLSVTHGDSSGLPIRGYGVMLLCGVVSGVLLAAYRARSMGLDPELIFSLAFVMFIAGIIGARVFYVIQYRDQFDSLTSILSVTNGGLVVYGSVIGGLGAGIIFVVQRGLSPLAIGDIIAPSMVLGLAFGRLGCLFNGCCFGGVCETEWAPRIEFPGISSAAPSPPYQHQRMHGHLHGFRLGEDEEGHPIIESIIPAVAFPDNPALASELFPGDRVYEFELAPFDALAAASHVDWPEGSAVVLMTASGKKIRAPIERQSDSPPRNEVGFDLTFDGGGNLIAHRVAEDSEAAAAGLEDGMAIQELRLPPIESVEVGKQVLDFAQRVLIVHTATGVRANLSIAELRENSLPVHPTQIYSSVNAFLLCGFLWFLYPFRRRDGEVFAMLLVTYPVARILLEAIRTDVDPLSWAPLTISQFISACILSAGILLWVFLFFRPRGSVLPRRLDPASGNG